MTAPFVTMLHGAAVLALLATAAPRAGAMPPSYPTLQGDVASVDPAHNRFTLRTDKTPAGLSLAWGPRTEFFRDGKLAKAGTLQRGQQVTARYRHPFFGPLYAGRVFILPAKK